MTKKNTMTKLRSPQIASWMFGWVLFTAVLTSSARAECPAVGDAQLNWKNTSIALPDNTSDFLDLIQDTCTAANPPATFVTAKLMLENQTDTTQTAECWLETTKASDYGAVTLAPKGRAVMMLEIANLAGGSANANRANVMCRNASAGANTVNATWLKIVTKVVKNVTTFQAP